TTASTLSLHDALPIYRGGHVCHPGVGGDLQPAAYHAALMLPQRAGDRGDLVVGGGDHPTLAAGDVLGGVERESAETAKEADMPAPPGGPYSLGGILEN